MARVLLAWEMGGGNGHITQIAPVAASLVAMGHAVSAVMRNGRAAQRALQPLGVRCFAAPVQRALRVTDAYVDSYAGMLLQCGYAEVPALAASIDAWRGGIASLRPDLLVADFAPTAMLAARLGGVPVAAIGHGYSLPPRTRPLPFTRAWDPPPDTLAGLDTTVTANVNAAFRHLGSPIALVAAEETFASALTFMCSFPELDHYERRGPCDYFGPIYADRHGAAPHWPPGTGPRIFAYASAGHPAFAALVAALAALGWPTVMYASGLAGPHAPTAATIAISPVPLHVASAVTACDIVVCQGIGTASAALAGGRPVLMLPEYLEQMMTVNRVVGLGAGRGVERHADAATIAANLQALWDQPRYRASAAAFGHRYAGFDPAASAGAIAAEIDDYLRGSAAASS